jgi:hypothetical protein
MKKIILISLLATSVAFSKTLVSDGLIKLADKEIRPQRALSSCDFFSVWAKREIFRPQSKLLPNGFRKKNGLWRPVFSIQVQMSACWLRH